MAQRGGGVRARAFLFGLSHSFSLALNLDEIYGTTLHMIIAGESTVDCEKCACSRIKGGDNKREFIKISEIASP